MVTQLRMGGNTACIREQASIAIITEYESLRSGYERRAINARNFGFPLYEPFEDLPRRWLVNKEGLIQAFLLDYEIHREELTRELQSVRTVQILACDHSRSCLKLVKRGGEGKHLFTITGDLGLILNYCVVPRVGAEYTHLALDKVVERHRPNCPQTLFVDCNCCNGKLRNPYNAIPVPQSEWEAILVKKLDGWHCLNQIVSVLSKSHPRHKVFCAQLAEVLYNKDAAIAKRLDDIRSLHGLSLSYSQKKRDWSRYRRQVPRPGNIAAQNLVLLLQAHIKMDQDVKE
jgi:hypothetical protein